MTRQKVEFIQDTEAVLALVLYWGMLKMTFCEDSMIINQYVIILANGFLYKNIFIIEENVFSTALWKTSLSRVETI